MNAHRGGHLFPNDEQIKKGMIKCNKELSE
jgi:hypothetical protein